MSEINVNIRGRSDGSLDESLNNLRDKAVSIKKELMELDGWQEMTPTQQKVAAGNLVSDRLEQRKSLLYDEFDELRTANLEDLNRARERFSSGDINQDEYDEQIKAFQQSQDDLGKAQDEEILQVEKEMNETLKDILKEFQDEAKIAREKAQQDREEFKNSGGLAGQLLRENRELRKQQFLSEDEDEIADLQNTIDQNNAKLREMKRPGGGGRGGGPDDPTNDFIQGAGAFGTGDMMGAMGGGIRGVGKVGGFAKGAGITAIAGAIIKEILGFGEGLQESMSPVAAFRGRGYNEQMGTSFSYLGDVRETPRDYGAVGLSNEDIAMAMNRIATGSRVVGADLEERAYQSETFKKGFGADSDIFLEFERFNRNGETSVDVALETLNVLTSIEESSLKEDNLVTLAEKLQSQQAVMSLQRQKRDMVDSNQALQIVAAFESIGLSQKGERGGDFLQRTISGLQFGGSDIEQMIKIEAMKRARPDLINDPAALRRETMFNADNPEYMSEFFKMAQRMTGGNEMAMDDMLMTIFNVQSSAELEMLKKAMQGGEFNRLLRGKGLETEQKESLTTEQAFLDAESGVGVTNSAIKDFSNAVQNLITLLNSGLTKFTSGDSVKVSVESDKTKKPSNSKVVGNKFKKGD